MHAIINFENNSVMCQLKQTRSLTSIYRGLMYRVPVSRLICYEIDSLELVGFYGVCVRSVSDNNGQHRITRPCVCHNGCI